MVVMTAIRGTRTDGGTRIPQDMTTIRGTEALGGTRISQDMTVIRGTRTAEGTRISPDMTAIRGTEATEGTRISTDTATIRGTRADRGTRIPQDMTAIRGTRTDRGMRIPQDIAAIRGTYARSRNSYRKQRIITINRQGFSALPALTLASGSTAHSTEVQFTPRISCSRHGSVIRSTEAFGTLQPYPCLCAIAACAAASLAIGTRNGEQDT